MKSQDRDYIMGLFPSIKQITDRGIQEKIINVWYTSWKRSNFARIEDVHQFEPARDQIDYTNVDHTNQVVSVCEAISGLLSELLDVSINMDYLLAGALLCDVDKALIFDSETGNLTETGEMFPHAVMGAMLAFREGLPKEVAHIIEAHSIKSSPVLPRSIEALIVRYVDHIIGESVYLAKGVSIPWQK
jgi:putative nucleotidyltransferase with HDIG domain